MLALGVARWRLGVAVLFVRLSELHPHSNLSLTVAAHIRDLSEPGIEHVRDDPAEGVAVQRVEQFAANLDLSLSRAERLLDADVLVEERRLAYVQDQRCGAQREWRMIDDDPGSDPAMVGVVAL